MDYKLAVFLHRRIVNLIVLSCISQVCSVYISRESRPFSETEEDCEPVYVTSSDTLQTALGEAGISAVWLPVRRQPLNGWFWMNGSFYRKQISEPPWWKPGMDCAVLQVVDKTLDDVRCNETFTHYLCQSTDPGISCVSTNSSICVQHDGVSYTIYEQHGSWYDAVHRCSSAGLQLASLDQPDESRQKLFSKINNSLRGRFTSLWVGLRLKEYRFTEDNGTVVNFAWGERGACACPDRDCVVLHQSVGGEITWRQVSCAASFNHICSSFDISTPETGHRQLASTSSTRAETTTVQLFLGTKEPSYWNLLIILVVVEALSLFLLLVAVIVIIYLLVMVKRLRREKEKSPVMPPPDGRTASSFLEVKPNTFYSTERVSNSVYLSPTPQYSNRSPHFSDIGRDKRRHGEGVRPISGDYSEHSRRPEDNRAYEPESSVSVDTRREEPVGETRNSASYWNCTML